MYNAYHNNMILLGEHEDVEIESRTRSSDHQENEAASSDEEGEGQRSGFFTETITDCYNNSSLPHE